MEKIRENLILVALFAVAALFGASIYESVVLAPNFNVAIPGSLENFRQFLTVTNPGTFFRVVAPTAQILLLISLVLGWKNQATQRGWLSVGLVAPVIADVITFKFHYPRNALLFREPLKMEPALLEKAAREWANGNYVRIALVTIALISLIKVLKTAIKAKPI